MCVCVGSTYPRRLTGGVDARCSPRSLVAIISWLTVTRTFRLRKRAAECRSEEDGIGYRDRLTFNSARYISCRYSRDTPLQRRKEIIHTIHLNHLQFRFYPGLDRIKVVWIEVGTSSWPVDERQRVCCRTITDKENKSFFWYRHMSPERGNTSGC